MAWVPEVGVTAKRNGKDRQETFHSGFQNKIDLHQSTRWITGSKLNSQKILLAPRLANICVSSKPFSGAVA